MSTSTLEAENVCHFLKSKGIDLNPNNDWLKSCINWYKTHLELKNTYGALQEYVCIQWLLADLRDVQNKCLPINLKDRVTEVNGKYSVQINWVRDIGQSCYSQLREIEDTKENDEYFSVDEQKKSSWEPKCKRVLMMELTDGVTTLKAMEYLPIPKLIEPLLPGFKAILLGPIECRNGILLLQNKNINLLGGEVDQMFYQYSKENILLRCLNLPTTNGIQERFERPAIDENQPVNVPVEDSPSTVLNVLSGSHSQPLFTMEESRLENNVELNPVADSSMLMTDDDDDFLRELPDEVLDHPDPNDINLNELSPVLGRPTHTNNRFFFYQSSNNELSSPKPTNSKPQQKETMKPKLFSSLEELQTFRREEPSSSTMNSYLPKQNYLSSESNLPVNHNNRENSHISLPSPSISEISAFPNKSVNALNKSVESSSGGSNWKLDSTIGKINNAELDSPTKDDVNIRNEIDNDEDSMDCIMINDNKYPQYKKLELKVQSITNLKIRNGEWYGSADVVADNQLMSVMFSNEVLKKLFGIAALEVEVWRYEMKTNPSLKKKVNDILKAGQTKLKILRCAMTLEYSAEECTPRVTIIHHDS